MHMRKTEIKIMCCEIIKTTVMNCVRKEAKITECHNTNPSFYLIPLQHNELDLKHVTICFTNTISSLNLSASDNRPTT